MITYIFRYFAVFFSCNLLLISSAFSQTVITGKVTDKSTGQGIGNATIIIKGTLQGTFTAKDGSFNISANLKPPFVLQFSFIGYKTMEYAVNNDNASMPVNIALIPTNVLGQEVVISASRVPEKIIQSPVSIERLSHADLLETPSPEFYNALRNLKGVDIVTSSLLFTTITTRGFGGSGNILVNQFVDGMDNQAPGLNFSVSNLNGLTELDIDNVELLPGASSALYGSGGTNGTIIMTGKSPFTHQGLSALIKGGVMHVNDNEHGATPYSKYVLRYAKAFKDKFAFKINAAYVKAYDWMADDTRNYDAANFTVKPGTRSSDPAYDGINIYGDETSANIHDVALQMAAAGAITPEMANAVPVQTVSRTGYNEKYLVDYNTYNLKLGGTLAYKITPSTTASFETNWGRGTAVYTGADRYSLKNFDIGQYKLQLDGKNFMLRGYTTQENAGQAYNATVLGQLINEAWSPSTQWYPNYVGAYLQAKQSGAADAQAFATARTFADQDMPQPGSAQFNELKNKVRSLPIPQGALFTDKSSLYNYEGFYNFSSAVKIFDLQAGANFRRYHLNSKGTLFDDQGKKLTNDQFGFFTQASKKFWQNRVELIGSLRYDKNENFAGKWTPRIAGVFTVAPENNIRISYQTGYALPTNQFQYIDLNVGRARLVGNLPQFITKYHLEDNASFLLNNVLQYGATFQTQFQKNLQAGQSDPEAQYNAAVAAEKVLTPYQFKKFEPESVQSYEIGYRGIIKQKLMIDAYVYFCNYKNFFGSIFLVQDKNGPQQITPQDPTKYYGPGLVSDQTRNVYEMETNSDGTIKTFGWALGLDYRLPAHFHVNANVSYNKLKDAPAGFFTQYNTPDYRANIGFGNNDVYKGLGFDIVYRYQDAFYYQGSFAVGNVPAVNTIDAQISYKIPALRLLLKLGGSNILNHYYQNAFGNPMIGGLYYLSVGYNVFN